MTQIVFKNYIFTDANKEIISATGSLSQSLIGDQLAADEFNFVVQYDPAALGYYIEDSTEGSGFFYTADDEVYCVRTDDSAEIADSLANFSTAEAKDAPVDIYNDGVKIGRFYVQKVYPIRINQDGSVLLQFNALSLIGLTVSMDHNGGIYSNAKAGDVIAEILQATKNTTKSTSTLLWYDMPSGLHYTIDAAVANTRIDGTLPITGRGRSARDNLRDVLLVTGASTLKDTEGSVRFTFNQPSEPVGIESTDIYTGDDYTDDDGDVTVVKVVANSYRAVESDPVTEYESAEYVDHVKVLFDEPVFRVYSSQDAGVDTLTIHEWGPFYAIVSGTGTLYGMPYLNTQTEYSETIREGLENSRTAGSGLISLLNYKNVLDRMANWYQNHKVVSSGIVVDGTASTGSLVSFNDPMRTNKTGFIQKMTFYLSGIIKGDTEIVTDWLPTGTGNNFSLSQTLTGSGTWSKAAAEAAVGHPITLVRFDLIGGGDGGAPGEDGEAGAVRRGGKGGAAGSGGNPGRVYSVTFEGDDIPDTITFNCGEGGQPGEAGTNSTIVVNGTTYSSSSGSRPAYGYMDILTGIVRAEKGPDGIAGGDGGTYTTLEESTIEGVTGKSVTYKNRTWRGGTFGKGYSVDIWRAVKYGNTWQREYTGNYANAAASSTGGAAFGRNSAAGTYGHVYQIWNFGQTSYVSEGNEAYAVGVGRAVSGTSSDGASALPIDDYTPSLGSGGAGGNGGGGGGSKNPSTGAGGYKWTGSTYEAITGTNSEGHAGAGGAGSLGTAGGNGFINAYI